MTTIIIGAGIAGIAAASELRDYIVLDPRAYIGGRVHTERIPIEPMEVGAGWFHGVLEGEGDSSSSSGRTNPLVKIAEDAGVPLAFDDEKFVLATPKGPIENAAELAAEWDKFRLGNKEQSVAEAAEAFASHSKHPAARDFALGFQFVGGTGRPAAKVSSHYSAPAGRDKVPLHGYDAIFKVLMHKVDRRKVHLSSEVDKITVHDNEVEVRVKGNPKPFKGSNVIVTVPLGVLQDEEAITFSPALPAPLKEAIGSGRMASIAKVYVEFPKQFWGDFDKALVVGEDPALIYNWSKAHHSDRHILSVLIVNETCVEAEKETAPKAIWELVEKYFGAVNESEAPIPHPSYVKSTKWSLDPYTHGAISAFDLGASRADAVAAFEQGAAPIYFAGEHTSLEGAACVHGAYLSGLRAAKQVGGLKKDAVGAPHQEGEDEEAQAQETKAE